MLVRIKFLECRYCVNSC